MSDDTESKAVALRAAGEKALAGLENAGERARAGLEQAQRKSKEVVAATREKGGALIEDTREKGYRAAAETNRLFQEHPIATVAAAAAAGAIVGIFLPKLGLASKAGKVAGKAMKVAVTNPATKTVWSSVQRAGKSAKAKAQPTKDAASDEAGEA